MRGTRSARRAGGLATVAGLLAAALSLPASADPGPAPPSRQRVIVSDAHADVIDVRYTGGALTAKTKLDSGMVAASDVLFQLRDNESSRTSIPDIPEFAFLGPVGTPVWIAPQVQDPALLWAGWNTLGIAPGVLAGDAVDIRLVSVTGPGYLEMFTTDEFGSPGRVFSSRDAALRTVRQPVNDHVHANWAFSALGRYELTFEITGADPAGQPLSTGPVTYAWSVGDIQIAPSTTALTVSPPSANVGQEVTLTGSVGPASAAGWLEFLDGTNVLGHAAVAGGTATFTTSGLSAGSHQLSARFVPVNSTDHQPSGSEPVAYQVSGTSTSTTTTTRTTTTTTRTTAAAGSTTTTTGTTTSCAPTAAAVLKDGHADYGARIIGGGLSSQIKDTAWREPGEVAIQVVPAAATTLPANGFDFLGRPGDRIWQIPQTQRAGILWLGWNTEEITAAQVRGGVTWSLDRVAGPGTLAVYLLNTFGVPQIVFNSGDGVPDRYEIPLGTHAHGNWAFTKEGVYRATFTQSATLASGATVSDTEVVTFAVGSAAPPPAGCAIGTGAAVPKALGRTGWEAGTPLAIGGLLVLLGVSAILVVRRRGLPR